jgi:2-oxoglutarate ferredoxin oxidoreductase subunit gamma
MVALTGLITKESIIKVLEYKIPRDFLEMNRKALDIGMALGGRVTESTA